MFEYDISFFRKSADYVKSVIGDSPDTAIVMGSGMGGFVTKLRDPIEIPYASIPNFLISTVKYHEGKLVFGRIGNQKVLCMCGRFHHYEGYSFAQLSIPIRMFKLLGVRQTILTNAAGAVNPAFNVGDIMVISDHIKFSSLSPMAGPNIEELGERFFDVSNMYTASLRELALDLAKESGLTFREGVYMFFAGPQFETPAEIRMARILGADAVGMSTVPEALTAAHCGMPILAFSVITNMAAGIVKDAHLSHEEVAASVSCIEHRFNDYLEDVIVHL